MASHLCVFRCKDLGLGCWQEDQVVEESLSPYLKNMLKNFPFTKEII